jgi:enamine deaminase RidA (YjgF/YER057c/UK114 family)
MKTSFFTWLGREFIEIVAEGKAGVPPDVAIQDLFATFESELKEHGQSLDDSVRVRVWGRDRAARTLATAARSRILTGNRKAASSSFISQQWFDSDGTAGLELLAMKPLNSGAERRPVEFEPARNYLCYLEYDSTLFFSGFTSEAETLELQTREVLATLDHAFARAGTEWSKVKELSLLVQRAYGIETTREVLASVGRLTVPEIDFMFVDGFAGEKYLLEIEATALKF